jgi:hypothetical protein
MIQIKFDLPEQQKAVLTNCFGDTYTVRSEELIDFLLRAAESSTPTSQPHKAMSAEEFLINQGYTKIVTYPNKEVVEITFRWETVIRLLNEYTSQPQPLPVGGKSVENCFDEIGNKINTLQDVNLKNRLHAAKDLLKLHLQSSLPVQQPVSDGVEWIEIKSEKDMPPVNVIPGVMVYSKRGGIDVQPVYNKGNWMPKFQEGWNKGETFEVTHWMPLPNPPKQ